MPYSNQPAEAFWKACEADPGFRVDAIHRPKFALTRDIGVATAGSCFAQHITRRLRGSAARLVEPEPGPVGLPAEVAEAYGYGLFSARYGNIYSARQLRQLFDDALAGRVKRDWVWRKGDRHVDALRPACEPDGLPSEDDVLDQRRDHLRKVDTLMREAEVLIFTLGLTEMWAERRSGRVFPLAPGVIAGDYDPKRHEFKNATVAEVKQDLLAAFALLRKRSRGARLLLTVSPVPLAATATGGHIFTATQHSKATLRAAAGELVAEEPAIDYFPSYELVTGAPFDAGYIAPNAREVSKKGVDFVMSAFFAHHPAIAPEDDAAAPDGAEDPELIAARAACEERLLDGLAPP